MVNKFFGISIVTLLVSASVFASGFSIDSSGIRIGPDSTGTAYEIANILTNGHLDLNTNSSGTVGSFSYMVYMRSVAVSIAAQPVSVQTEVYGSDPSLRVVIKLPIAAAGDLYQNMSKSIPASQADQSEQTSDIYCWKSSSCDISLMMQSQLN